MLFIGDTHGKFRPLRKICAAVAPKKCIQLGDMGLGFGMDYDFPNCENLSFIRGNHDSPKVCRNTSSFLGDFGYLEKEDIFFVSGAFSVDKRFRTIGRDWWEDEELSYEQWERVHKLYEEHKPKIVITHGCPYRMISSICGNPIRSITATGLDALLNIHQPEIWVFAHFHIFKTITEEKTLFVALGELDVWDSDTRKKISVLGH